MIKVYHIFTHNTDEWLDDYKDALVLFEEFIEDYGCARLYVEVYEDDQAIKDDEMTENCIKSYGDWPH